MGTIHGFLALDRNDFYYPCIDFLKAQLVSSSKFQNPRFILVVEDSRPTNNQAPKVWVKCMAESKGEQNSKVENGSNQKICWMLWNYSCKCASSYPHNNKTNLFLDLCLFSMYLLHQHFFVIFMNCYSEPPKDEYTHQHAFSMSYIPIRVRS